MYLRIFFCHALLLGFASCSPVESKISKKSMPEPPTETPIKGVTTKSINKEQVQNTNYAQTERPATKKRDVPGILSDRGEYFDDDFAEGKSADDYDSIQALKAYLDSAKQDNFALDLGKYRANDYRYYDEDARKKRTVVFDDIFNKPDTYFEPEIQLTPEDLMALAAYRQQQRLYSSLPYGRWADVNNQIEVPDAEMEADEIYNDRPENVLNRFYDQRYQNWANLPRNDKMIPKRQMRSIRRAPKIRVPLYRRAIL